MSKAKSGLSAVRAFDEKIAYPPNDFTAGSSDFTTGARDGKGHAALVAAVTNNTTGTLQILEAWQAAGPFVRTHTIATSADPESGYFVANAVVPITRRYVKVKFVGTLGAAFELGAYFCPRPQTAQSSGAGGGSGASAVANRSSFNTGQKTGTGVGNGLQLSSSSIPIPDGFAIAITAPSDNASAVQIGASEAEAEDASNCYLLGVGLTVKLYVTDVNKVWIAAASGDDVTWIVEE